MVHVLYQVFVYQLQGVSLHECLLIALLLESPVIQRNSNQFGLFVQAGCVDPSLK